jgi:hypothetical protein
MRASSTSFKRSAAFFDVRAQIAWSYLDRNCVRGPRPQRTLLARVRTRRLDLAREGMTCVLVTHEMGFAREAANQMYFTDNGLIVETAPPDRFFANPQDARTRSFLYSRTACSSQLRVRYHRNGYACRPARTYVLEPDVRKSRHSCVDQHHQQEWGAIGLCDKLRSRPFRRKDVWPCSSASPAPAPRRSLQTSASAAFAQRPSGPLCRRESVRSWR